MAKISAGSLYIVVTYVSYDGISGDTENVYTDKAEAEIQAAESNAYMLKCNSTLKYSVMSLDDYIREYGDSERSKGAENERNTW